MTLRVVLAACEMQFSMIVRRPSEAVALVTTPLLSMILLSIVRHAERDDLLTYAVIGASLMGLWNLVVMQVSGLIDADRWMGRLELLMTAPVPLHVVLFGRLLAVVMLGVVAFAESYLVAAIGFDFRIVPVHPLLLVVGLLATLFAIAGVAAVISSLFILSRDISQFQIALTYPLYILGAVVFPPEVLPQWVRPVTNVIFLNWSAGLLRDAFLLPAVEHVFPRVLGLVTFGVVAFVVARLVTAVVRRKVGNDGSAVLA